MKKLLLIFTLIFSNAIFPICQIQMFDKIDTEEKIEGIIELREIEPSTNWNNFMIRNGVGTIEEERSLISISKEQERILDFGPGLNGVYNLPITVEELTREYQMEDSEDFSFEVVKNHNCTTLEKSLIYFYIIEWFYYRT